MPKLQVFLPDGTEVTHELTEDTVTIGRVSDNVLQIDDPSVSSRHAELTLVAGDYHLRDLGSTNGTLVNGKTFSEWQLEDGDQVQFGNINTAYSLGIAASPRPLPAEEEHTVTPAASSQRPSDFSNASPFKARKKKRDPIGTAIVAFTILAMLVFGGAVSMILTLRPPH